MNRTKTDDTTISRIVWALTALTLLVSGSLVFGERGVSHKSDLESVLEDLSAQAYDRIVRNARLRDELAGLRSDRRSLEEVARTTLGVVHDNEIVYVFPSSSRSERW